MFACRPACLGPVPQIHPLPPLAVIRARRAPYRFRGGPQGGGVYFLFVRWALSYVGQSVDIAYRLERHYLARCVPFNAVAHIEADLYELDRIEAHYIRTLQPRFNVRGK